MSEVVVYRHPERPIALAIDTDDIASFETPRDVHDITCAEADCPGCNAVHRKLGPAHLNLTFKPGKMPLWRDVAAEDPEAGPRRMPPGLAEAISSATWTEL